MGSMAKHPSAFIPIAMSLLALATVIVHIAVYGAVRESDEGAAAHIFQLLLAGQVPVIAYFAVKWLARAPAQALAVLGMQCGAALAAMAPVFFFKL